MRVVLDANVLVSALISTVGPSREIVTACVDERFELIASPTLINELHDVLSRPRFRRWVSIETAHEFIDGLVEDADVVEDPPPITGITPDPDDNYLVGLARGPRRLPGLRRPPPTRARRGRRFVRRHAAGGVQVDSQGRHAGVGVGRAAKRSGRCGARARGVGFGRRYDSFEPMRPRKPHQVGSRARVKQSSRRVDERALASGSKSAAQIRRENESFAALAGSVHVNFAASRSLG